MRIRDMLIRPYKRVYANDYPPIHTRTCLPNTLELCTMRIKAIYREAINRVRKHNAQQYPIRIRTVHGEVTLFDNHTVTLSFPSSMVNTATNRETGVILGLVKLRNDAGCLVVDGPMEIRLFSTRQQANDSLGRIEY